MVEKDFSNEFQKQARVAILKSDKRLETKISQKRHRRTPHINKGKKSMKNR
jgi:hypothetical protein